MKIKDPYTGEVTDDMQEMLDKEIIYDLRSLGFRVGDQVRSKNPQGQVKIPGTIVGLLDASFYVEHMLNAGGKRTPYVDPDVIWGKNNPCWKQQLVAIVFFNIPQKSATKEEWVESGVAQGFLREDCEASYEKACPMMQQMALPINDLELVK